MRTLPIICVFVAAGVAAQDEPVLVEGDFKLANVLPPIVNEDDPRSSFRRKPGELPIVVKPFVEHVRAVAASFPAQPRLGEGENATATASGYRWVATDHGLYRQKIGAARRTLQRYASYGVGGPLATRVTSLAVDSKGALWCGTPLGLSRMNPDGSWDHIRGKDGLPYEDITSIALDSEDRMWLGTTRGAIHYRPYGQGRQWFYRAGQRYLPDDHVLNVAVTRDGRTAYFETAKGPGRIDAVRTTLIEKARTIERRLEERHRRLGLVAACVLDDPHHPTSHRIVDNDNDGLWTAYHVAAMSLCYGATADEDAKRSARTSLHALVMLQNASGTPGLVARSVVPLDEGRGKSAQWRLTPDGTRYWKSDTSSDEIDGHYLALFTYWQHIARFDAPEQEIVVKQVRDMTDYLIAGGYRLIDWDGERTRWGFWDPALLNGEPEHYLENGLNSLQILSFLKVAHHITGDAKYKGHYDTLITDHGYLSNVLLQKKVFPDENNHSDDQLAYVAWYPLLQLERDPRVRSALYGAVRRHYRIVAPERSSFFNFVTATIDPDYVDIEAGIENLKRIPTDRRRWRMENSHRADIVFDPRIDRFGRTQLLEVLPVDERDLAKWNSNPYRPDAGGDGREEDDGAAYLLPYWMGRYHGFLREG